MSFPINFARRFYNFGKDAGYTYVNIDDCWNDRSRDPTTNRLQPDLRKFPSGIKEIVSRVHNMGLKMGIYSSAGKTTCKKLPASLGYELIDAETWAEWQIDCLFSRHLSSDRLIMSRSEVR